MIGTASTGTAGPRSQDALTKPLLPGYAAAIAGAEFALTFISPLLGVILYIGILVTALTHYALRPIDVGRRILPALALVPLLRVESLVMPIEDLPRILWYVLAGVPVLLAIALSARALQLHTAHVGLRMPGSPWVDALAAASGLPLAWIAYQAPIERLPVETASLMDLIVIMAVLAIFVALLEELLFRGVLHHLARQDAGPIGPVIVTVIYATLFISSYSAVLVGLMLLAGTVFAFAVARGSSMLGVTVGHSLMLFGGLVAPAVIR